MQVRGITVLTRKAIVTRRFGSDAWAGFFRDIASAHPAFLEPVTATSFVPLPAYLAFHDELVRRFFGDSGSGHADLGRESARWALTEGPFKDFMKKRTLRQFVMSFPKLWKMYFAGTTSRSQAAIDGNTIDFKVFGLPCSHPYLEQFIVGYMRELIELYCANPIAATRVGGSGVDYHYRLATAPIAPTSEVPESSTTMVLSDREMEVLQLVAQGKTNNEIGIVLGISGKTVQHHVARAYRKIDVSGRVGAVMWLAQRGMVGN